jgi:hypothetical protein
MVLHTKYLIKYGYPPNFIYYFIIDCFSFFTRKRFFVNLASLFVLSTALVLKFKLIVKILMLHQKINLFHKQLDLFHKQKLGFMLMLIFSLPSVQLSKNHYYLGQLTPNVWHNSTTMFLMPIACYVMLLSLNAIVNVDDFNWKSVWYIVLWVLVSVFVKPSFAFLYSPMMFIFGIIKNNNKLVLIGMVTSFFILFQYYLIYNQNGYMDQSVKSSVEVDFLFVWKSWLGGHTSLVLLSFVVSLIFPILYLFFFFRELQKDIFFLMSIIMFVIGMLMFIFLKEDGPRVYHGNFMWSVSIGLFFLWLSLISDFKKRNLPHNKVRLFNWLFKAHFFSGLFYICYILISGRYL